jgi:hypothetical protein
MTATTTVTEKGLNPSPFSVSLETELKWETMSSKETMIRNGVITCSEENKALINDLAIIGVIGSVQCSRIYWKMDKDKKQAKKSVELRYLKKHQLIRGKTTIPIYTLGATGFFIAELDPENEANKWKQLKKHEVLQRLAFFQLYAQLRAQDPTIFVEPAELPFVCNINRRGKPFSVLVVRGNENTINNFFKYESDKLPDRMIIIAESLNHLNPIQNAIKPFLNRIRVTTDHDLKESFEKMFYLYSDNNWLKEQH